MLRHRPFVSKTYEFETTDRLYFYKFIQVLEEFGIADNNQYFGSTYDYHTIKFACEPSTRVRIEYIFRRLIGLDRLYLLNLDDYQDRAARYRRENYEIL